MTDEAPRFTVAIPTYNRAESVARRVAEFLELRDREGVELLVVDNDSPDGTFDVLSTRFDEDDIRILKNDANLGFAGNFLRLIREARGEYLTVFSDEDLLHPDGFTALREFCRRNKPDMISPRAQAGQNTRYRGRRRTRLIRPREFQSASFYLSGLTFATKAAREAADVVTPLLQANSVATVYPQVLVSALLISRQNSYFLDALVSSQREVHETMIVEASGDRYNLVPGRWAQFRGYEDFFAMDHSAIAGARGTQHLREMREQIRTGILDLVVDAAIREKPNIAPYLRRRLRRQLGRRLLTRLQLLLRR